MGQADEGERGKRRPRRRAADADLPGTLDPIDIAMDEGRGDVARRLLEQQSRLIDADLRHRNLQIRAERVTIALRSLLGLAVLSAVAGLAAMAWNASQSRGWVVESFAVPPALAAQGLTGEVVASKLIDRVTAMRAATVSARVTDTLESGWRNDYRVEIPQTGISIGDVQAALRRWLGKDIRIGGELIRTPKGLALTVRSDRGSATVEAGAGEIDALIEKAADVTYAKTAPYLHAVYIQNHDRVPEARAAFRALTIADVDDTEKAWALFALGYLIMTADGRCADAIPLLERSHRLDPTISNSVSILASAHECLGHNQDELDARRRALAIGQGTESASKDRKRAQRDLITAEAQIANRTGDSRGELAAYDRGDYDRFTSRANALSRLGDVRGSRAMLRQFEPDPVTDEDRRVYWNARYRQAQAVEDWNSAALFGGRVVQFAASRTPDGVAFTRTGFVPLLAVTRARAGDLAGAESLLRDLPSDCYGCARGRAGVAEIRGDRAAADRWFAAAVRLGPRIPFAWAEWGEARLRRGDPAKALVMFNTALLHGPNFAAAMKGKADSLSALRRHREAAVQYAEAAERAPRWGKLHIDWAIALLRDGDGPGARAKLRAASGMDLGASDRRRLQRVMAAAQPASG